MNYKALFEADPRSMCVLDPDSLTFVAVNDAAVRRYGYSREEVLSMTIAHTRSSEDLLGVILRVERDLGALAVGSWEHTRKDGTVVGFDIRSLFLEQDDVQRRLVLVTEVAEPLDSPTRAEQLQRELRESESDIRQILGSLPVAVYVLDAEGHPRYANSFATELLGVGSQLQCDIQDPSETFSAYKLGTDDPYPAQELPSVRALKGADVHADDLEVRHHGGAVRLEVWATPLRDLDGNIKGAVSVSTDITSRRWIEDELKSLTDDLANRVAARTLELQQANKELESFAYSVAHDLRAPLRAIAGYSQILEEDMSRGLLDGSLVYLDVIKRNAKQMGQLIDDLLSFSRLSRQAISLEVVDCAGIVARTLETLRAGEGDAREMLFDVETLPPCQADPRLLPHVFTNLLSNSIKYTRGRRPARIHVGSRPGQAGEIIYFVKDNGAGFDMRYVAKLFGVFQRLHSASDFEGTGVGLAIVARIVERCGGRVWAEGVEGEGASFYVALKEAKDG